MAHENVSEVQTNEKLEFKDQQHSELLEMSSKALKLLVNNDSLLSDLPYDVTIDEVNSQIAVAQGQSITVQLLRSHDSSLSVVIPQHTCTLLELRKAIERSVLLQQKRDQIVNEKISWRYVWRTYWLRHDENGYVMDNLLANVHDEYGISIKNTRSMFALFREITYLFTLILAINSLMWLEQVSRIDNLNSKCKLYKNNLRKTDDEALNLAFKHLLVDHRHKFVYCYIPKIACTNWKRILMYLSGVYNSTNLANINGSYAHSRRSTLHLIDLPQKQIDQIVQNYTFFVMVRHPFQRFLSAFRNKLESNNSEYFQKRIGRKLKLDKNAKISFEDFVSYIVTHGQIENEHWLPMHQLCLPCYFNYSMIGHLETIQDDVQAIFKLLNVTNIRFPESRNTLSTDLKSERYFKQLTLHQIEKLYEIYQLDFKLFDYNLNGILGYQLP